MFVAQVTGSVVSTQKVETMKGCKFLMVEPFRLDPQRRDRLVSTGRSFVAVDMLGAGVGDLVLITQGSSARFTPETSKLPVDCVIIGIVDSVHIDKMAVYTRNEQPKDQ